MRRLGGSNRSHERVRCSPVGVGDDAATNEQLQVTWLWSGSALPPIATDLGTPHIGSSVPRADVRTLFNIAAVDTSGEDLALKSNASQRPIYQLTRPVKERYLSPLRWPR